MGSWKFSSTLAEIDISRILREAEQDSGGTHEVIKVTVDGRDFMFTSEKNRLETAPLCAPLGTVTEFSNFARDPVSGRIELIGLAPFDRAELHNVVVFGYDLSRKLRGAVETKVEVF